MATECIVRGGTIVTMDTDWHLAMGDVHTKDGVIVKVGGDAVAHGSDYDVIDAEGALVIPGLVQSHVHMCQTLARGHADGLPLLDWLAKIVWPYESVLSEGDVSCAAQLACVELLLGGTTSILDMGTVRHTDALFEAASQSGLRATIGKAMMDNGEQLPAGLKEQTRASIDESLALFDRWHGRQNDRLRYAFAPRFALSCTDGLLREIATEARRKGGRLHTHASENRQELERVRKLRGDDNINYLHSVGMTGDDVGLAHCVWLTEAERETLVSTGTHLLHCPSSNLKLASGVAEVPELRERGVAISLGADGAPCNNNLDAFVEMRLTGLLHLPRTGAAGLHARDVVRMATMGGARALGLGDQVGSLEPGKRADITVVDITGAHVTPVKSPYSTLVYASRSSDVRHVLVDGDVLVRDKALVRQDPAAVVAEAQTRARAIFDRL